MKSDGINKYLNNARVKNIIKPITFYDEKDDTIVEFPFEFSQAVNLNTLFGYDGYGYTDLKNIDIHSHRLIIHDIDMDNRFIAVQQVLNFIKSQTIYIIINCPYFEEFYEAKYLFPAAVYPRRIFDLFEINELPYKYDSSSLSQNIECIIRSIYCSDLVSSYNDKESQINELITIVNIKGGQIAQLIITQLTNILESQILNMILSIKENVQTLEEFFDDTKYTRYTLQNRINKNSRLYIDLRVQLDEYMKGKITKEEVTNYICNYYRGIAYNLLNDVSMKIFDLCINTIINGTCTFFYGISDMIRFLNEKNC